MRPVTVEDLPELVRLNKAFDSHWFGAPESNAAEVREGFDGMLSPGSDSIALAEDGELLGAAWWVGTDALITVDPDTASQQVYDRLLAWIEAVDQPLAVNSLSRDAALVEALTRRGWRYDHSAFELIRDVSTDWFVAPPEWPSQIRLTSLVQPERVHDLIYRRAGWASMVGHGARDLAEWQRLFLPAAVRPADQIIAWEGAEMVGVALGRISSNGAGWVSQLAVAIEERGRGIGRGLLLEMLGRHVAAGATKLGLQVSGRNRGALALYLDVGLTVDREWQEFHRP